MNQKSPLLSFRVECRDNLPTDNTKIEYNFEKGLWIDISGVPIIEKFINDQDVLYATETLITETRESIDRSEGSNIDEFNFFDNGSTLITATRESVDRSENTTESNFDSTSNVGETLITRTREGIDRSESTSYNESLLFQTLTTYTRESVDRSENS